MSAVVAVSRHGACPCSTDGVVVWHDRATCNETAGSFPVDACPATTVAGELCCPTCLARDGKQVWHFTYECKYGRDKRVPCRECRRMTLRIDAMCCDDCLFTARARTRRLCAPSWVALMDAAEIAQGSHA